MGTVGLQPAARYPGAEENKLDRALLAGLMLEVVLETPACRVDPQIHRHLVKNRLRDSLVTHLAGQVTLDRFRHLLRELDHCFPRYYPLIASSSPQAPASAPGRIMTMSTPAAPTPPAHRVLREDVLKTWLESEARKLLPQRPHRKLDVKRLFDFLQGTRGGWFRLKDFERHFGVDRKTAWEYLQKFLSTGLLRHNQKRSAAVRYALATRFLVVAAENLGPKVREALPQLPQRYADKVCEWLVATGGEPFGEVEWHVYLKPPQCHRLLDTLKATGLLEEVGPAALSQMFQLPCNWLQD